MTDEGVASALLEVPGKESEGSPQSQMLRDTSRPGLVGVGVGGLQWDLERGGQSVTLAFPSYFVNKLRSRRTSGADGGEDVTWE